MSERPWYDDVIMPALLRSARMTYAKAMRHALGAAGFEDIPRGGLLVVGGIARNGPMSVSPSEPNLRVEALERLGYVERNDAVVTLTPRGTEAAATSAAAVAKIDAALADHVAADDIAAARRVLGTLIDLE